MDLKLVSYVLSLILLVTYGTEARKMVQENSQFPLFYKQGAEENSQFPLFYKQGVEDKHQQALKENTESVFSLFYKQGAEDKHQQALKENTESVFPLFYKQGAEENSQFPLFYKKGAEENSQFPLFYKQEAEDKHQQALKENTESVFPLFYKQGAEDKHQQALKENEHIHSSSHMDHIDPSQRIFFLMDDLKSWKAITVSFSKRALASSLQFFPKEAADSIPFTLKELPNLLQRFSFSKDSPQAKAMEQTIRSCEDSPIKGETKVCATSMEAMLDFVHGIMGEKTQIEALTNTKTQEVEAIAAQNYTFLDAPQEVAAPKMVACHTLPSAYPVYYCHHTISKSKVFKVSLRNDANGDRIEAIALCHLDTSGWSPSHVAFRALGILPGTSPLCHFIPSDNLVWVPKTIANGHATL